MMLLMVTPLVKAQLDQKDTEELLSLWIDQKYDKLVVKAMKYTDKDDTKNDPLPYLYAAKAFFRISLDETWVEKNEEFKKARKESINYASKYKKKDKNNTYQADAEEFYAELKPVMYEEAINDFDKGDGKKQASYMKKLTEFDPDYVGGYFAHSLSLYSSQNKSEGKKKATEALEKLTNLTSFNDYIDADKKFLCYTMYKLAEFLAANKDKALGIKIIQAGKSYFEKTDTEDEDMNFHHKTYQEVYNKLVNG